MALIRLAEQQDAAALLEIYRPYISTTVTFEYEVPTVEEFRRRIAEKPDEFLKMVKTVEKDTGVAIEAKEYKNPQQGSDPRLERFYGWKEQIGCVVHEDFGENTFGPELGDRVMSFLEKLTPLYDYFNNLGERV